MALHVVNVAVAAVATDLSTDTVDARKLAEVTVGGTSGDLIAAKSGRREGHRPEPPRLPGGLPRARRELDANKGIAVAGGETLVLPFAGAVDAVASGSSTPVRVQEL